MDRTELGRIKNRILALINNSESGRAESLARMTDEALQPEESEEFVAWCATVGIR